MSGLPCLQSIILNAHDLYASIRGYFVYKDENGYSSVGKPVLDKAVLDILQKILIVKDGDDQAEVNKCNQFCSSSNCLHNFLWIKSLVRYSCLIRNRADSLSDMLLHVSWNFHQILL